MSKEQTRVAFRTPFMSLSSSDMRKSLVSFLIGLVLGALGVWSVMGLHQQQAVSVPAFSFTGQMATTTQARVSESLFSVSAQPAGRTVRVTHLSLKQPEWVVVYEGVSGMPGNALGAIVARPQEQEIVVPLLRPTLAGNTYFVGTEPLTTANRGYTYTFPTLNVLQQFTAQ